MTRPAEAPATGRLAAMLDDLAGIGRTERGRYSRFAWTATDLELREWFVAQAAARGLDVTVDRAGNQWAWWGDPDTEGPGVVSGSHLDSAPHGGALDGPLGVLSAFITIDVLRDCGMVPAAPLGVVNFTGTLGARFGLPCVGSRVLTGAATPSVSFA
ncbi:hypothetical protein [Xylanimonas allomyrinae]|uniref:hypothetical protein n=1 Tax=Xylanimonas allomyrinae TaxID=2509459 RepID=UPI0013A5FC17|nr:hypothetical protein [Xylanimonas allomyrinae]